jgi:uncharacterized protein YciI
MTDESQEQNPLSRNFLGKNFYVVVTTPTAPREKLEPLIPAHLANQVRLEKEGIMFAAVPLTKEDGTRLRRHVRPARELIQRSPSDR